MTFEKSATWKRTLEVQQGDPFERERGRLRQSFINARATIEKIVGEIARDLPQYTVHDISHIDALWDYADTIGGAQFLLTPGEAYVLGLAFLLHDAGMTVASYPGGVGEVMGTDLWKDLFATRSRDVRPEDLDEIRRSVTADVLRILHAQRAGTLGVAGWHSKSAGSVYVVDDAELRVAFGQVSGLVAASHWFDAGRLYSEMNRVIGSPPFLPPDWTVDLLKVSCLLRVCDAAQIDARRAPLTLRMVRELGRDSEKHWMFQGVLTRPVLIADRLTYSSTMSFSLADADSWWLAYETLRMVDRELRTTDALLADLRQGVRLLAKGVSNIESPALLVRNLPVEGWKPIDAALRISDVPDLVHKMGGARLYGDDAFVAVRELIQNSCDAVRARRYLERRGSNWGEITVKLSKGEGGTYLEVSDNGIGMSVDTITQKLLDFGESYWNSELSQIELPLLSSSGFQSVGKFGIGFFSIFMLGDEIEVTTRRPFVGMDDTILLRIGGAFGRPILTAAEGERRLIDPGTSVRIRLSSNVAEQLMPSADIGDWKSFCAEGARVAPCCDVTIIFEDVDGETRELQGNSWADCSAEELLSRVIDAPGYYEIGGTSVSEMIERYAPMLTDVRAPDGVLLGRGLLQLANDEYILPEPLGVATVGGLRACKFRGFIGVFSAKTDLVSRNSATFLQPRAKYENWLSDQAKMLINSGISLAQRSELVDLLLASGIRNHDIKFLLTWQGELSMSELVELASTREEIIVVQDAAFSLARRQNDKSGIDADIILDDDVVVCSMGSTGIYADHAAGSVRSDMWGENRYDEPFSWFLEEMCRRWGISMSDYSKRRLVDKRNRRRIGLTGKKPVYVDAYVISKKKLIEISAQA